MSRTFLFALTLTLGCTAADPVEERGSWGTDPLPAAACVGDGDGVIGPGELVSAADLELHATFIVTGEQVDRPADPWDLNPPLVGSDRLLDLGPQRPSSFGFGDRFADAGFVSLMDAATGTYGAHRLDDDGLWLLGLADDVDTALVYDPPVLLVPLPLAAGDSWSVDADASGIVDGEDIPRDLGVDGIVSLRHRWAFDALGNGDVALPIGTLSATRVRATVTTEAHNSAAGLIASDVQRVDLYIAECLGVVGRVRSRIDEPLEDFVEATEILRLGLAAELRE